jgi:hypothetical protein
MLINKPSKTVRNTDFNQIPRLVECEGMVMNDLGWWLRSSPEEFGEIVHPNIDVGWDFQNSLSQSRQQLNVKH